jgi:hypothetical protein
MRHSTATGQRFCLPGGGGQNLGALQVKAPPAAVAAQPVVATARGILPERQAAAPDRSQAAAALRGPRQKDSQRDTQATSRWMATSRAQRAPMFLIENMNYLFSIL